MFFTHRPSTVVHPLGFHMTFGVQRRTVHLVAINLGSNFCFSTFSSPAGQVPGCRCNKSQFRGCSVQCGKKYDACTLILRCPMVLHATVNSGLIQADHTSLITKTLATHRFPHNSKIQLTNLLPANSQGGNLNLHVCGNHLREMLQGSSAAGLQITALLLQNLQAFLPSFSTQMSSVKISESFRFHR